MAALAVAASGVRGHGTLAGQQDRIDALAADIRRLEAEAAELRRQIRSLESDPAALELLARTDHQLVAPGEIVVLLDLDAPP